MESGRFGGGTGGIINDLNVTPVSRRRRERAEGEGGKLKEGPLELAAPLP